MSIHGEQYTSNRNPSHVSDSYSSLPNNVQTPHYQQDVTAPSNLENYANIASSSSYNRHPVHEDDGFDISSNGRWQYKRKIPDNNDSGSSSDPYRHGSDEESSVRNVRSRTECDFHDYYTTSGPTDVSSNGSRQKWDPTQMSSSVCDHELHPFLVGSSNSRSSIENDGQNNGLVTRTNLVHGSQGRLRLGNADERLQLAAESYSSPQPRPTIAWRSSERNARGKMSIERCQSFSEEASFHDRPMPEVCSHLVDEDLWKPYRYF